MSDVNCRIDLPSKDDSSQLTVGQLFHVYCEGDIPKLDQKTAELRLDASAKYKLKMLSLDTSQYRQLKLDLVSYQVGAHSIPAVQLVDTEHSVVLGDLNFTVKSVMDPQNPETEVYGPMGPIKLSWPMEYWLLLIIFSVTLLVVGFAWFIKRWKFQQQLTEIRLDQFQLPPLRYLQQQVRFEIRSHPHLVGSLPNLNSQWDLFISRLFKQPFGYLGHSKSKKFLLTRSSRIRPNEARESLKKQIISFYLELDLAKIKWGNYQTEEKLRFTEVMLSLAERIEKYQKELGA